uniref:Protein with SprT-like domain at the N terminus n=2 Tax=Dendroctonus ponderosae TaxID=77166 RepID=A0AAR5QI39_DENPD
MTHDHLSIVTLNWNSTVSRMGEVDYQMALLLQYKFEQENKRGDTHDADRALALRLQEQFHAEVETERPGNNLVYKTQRNLNNSKCLVDPSWEVIDPTPDVHVLFMAFNKKFFWNALESVTVSWSKRMTSCAGICSYQGRGGMCSITLSEPLLKLRPRKDLVETLLHEMIHAYLFVTHNNRDKDGHGPEFQKHMYRINAEAGTNITIYHDFYDEVRQYKQHWWKCNGPCQYNKPYFGVVRRATNRAPGPNDRWFPEHMRNCGGQFIKIKSPELPAKQQKGKGTKAATATSTQTKSESTKPSSNNDIRKYISSTSKPPLAANLKDSVASSLSYPNKIHTVSNTSENCPKVSNVIPSKASNIFGFTNVTSHSKRPTATAVKNSGSSTFVVTNKGSRTKPNAASKDDSKKVGSNAVAEVQPFSGVGRNLSHPSSTSSSTSQSYSKVREHWLKKFDKKSNPDLKGTGAKRRPSSTLPSSPQKVPKLCSDRREDASEAKCPVCGRLFKMELLNDHLDNCLKNQSQECLICSAEIPKQELQKHVSDCASKNFNDDFEAEANLTECPMCAKKIDHKNDPKHSDTCKGKHRFQTCSVCKKMVASQQYDIHLKNCLSNMKEFDRKCPIVENQVTSCLACGKQIVKKDLDVHLDDCMSMSNIFDTSQVPIEDIEDSDNKENCYNCPFCLELIAEEQMQSHMNGCFTSDNENSLLLETVYNVDSDSD